MSSASDATAIEITDLDLLPPAVRQAVLDLQAQVAHLTSLIHDGAVAGYSAPALLQWA